MPPFFYTFNTNLTQVCYYQHSYLKGEKMIKIIVTIGLLFSMAQAQMMMFQTVPEDKAVILQQGQDKMYCPNCGMYLPKFYKTTHAVELNDGTHRQYCSIYCLVEEMELTVLRGKHDTIKQILVVDVPSLKYVDAKTATYVVGSSKKGTMTTTSKYAFANVDDAKAFAAQNGGEVTDFDSAYNTALKDFAKDTGLVKATRGSKMYKMGEKLYNTQCDKDAMAKIDAHTMGEMKAIIKDNNICGKDLNDGQLQAIMLYNWDIRLEKFEKAYGKNKEVEKYANEFEKKFKNMNKQ